MAYGRQDRWQGSAGGCIATTRLDDRASTAVAVRPGVRLDGEVLNGLCGVNLDEVGEDHVEGVHCG